MKKTLPFLGLALLVVGCGEPAPTVGDAEISKGIARKPMPQPPPGMSATSGLNSRDLAKLRQRR